MDDNLTVWLDDKDHSVEGHNCEATLTFQGTVIWGPESCHDNTFALAQAIQRTDGRFNLIIERKSKTIESHTRYISVASHGRTLLDRLPTHDNMEGLIMAINNALEASR